MRATRWPIELGWWTLLALLLVIPRCAIDDRTLIEAEAGNGGQGAAPGSGGMFGRGGTGNGGTGNEAGAPGEDAGTQRCIFLEGSTETGCETLVENAGFQTDASYWSPENGQMVLSWTREDAAGSSASGSAVVTNLFYGPSDFISLGGGQQCIEAIAGTHYEVAADAYIPAGTQAGKAAINVLFFEEPDCTGGSSPGTDLNSVQEDRVDTWSHLRATGIAPEGAVSMSVRLVVIKPFNQISAQAFFDNVLVRAR